MARKAQTNTAHATRLENGTWRGEVITRAAGALRVVVAYRGVFATSDAALVWARGAVAALASGGETKLELGRLQPAIEPADDYRPHVASVALGVVACVGRHVVARLVSTLQGWDIVMCGSQLQDAVIASLHGPARRTFTNRGQARFALAHVAQRCMPLAS